MFSSTLDWYPANGGSTYSFNDVTTPMNDFDVQVNQRSDVTRTIPMNQGVYPTRTFRGAMTIHVEGQLFSSVGVDDAATAANYVAARKAMVTALFGNPTDVITFYYLGTMKFTPEGETELWTAQCTISAFSAPNQAAAGTDGGPARSAYLITFESFLPYFIGGTTGDFYYWS